MLQKARIGRLTFTVEGSWYEVSNGQEVIEYGNVAEETTPQEVSALLIKKGSISKTEVRGTYVYLPNREGRYHSVRVPQYVVDILANVTPMRDYIYRFTKVNSISPDYDIHKDLKKLEAWVKRYHADFIVKRIVSSSRKWKAINHLIPTTAIFEMTDPVAHQLENAQLIRR